MKLLVSFLVAASMSSLATAAPQSVTLSVPGMNCPVCPITVKKAILQVDGVSKVSVSLERREAVVVYDDAKTTADALARASTNAGYPAQERK